MLSPSALSTIQSVVGSVAPIINLKFAPAFNAGKVIVPPPAAFKIITFPESAAVRVAPAVLASTSLKMRVTSFE